jgi:periplasmic protein TonB
MIKGGGKNLAVSLAAVIVGLGVLAAATLFLDACGARHDEKATADNAANVNTSPAARPSDTEVVTPAMSPSPTNAGPTNAGPKASTEKTVVKSPRLVPPDSQAQQNSSAQSTPTQTLPGPGTGNGVGTGTGDGTGPGSGGGTGINPPNRARRNPADTDYSRVFNGKEVDQKARILEKPEPVYTQAARQNQINGAVALSVVLTASGQVTDIKVVAGLPDGLNESAIAAARLLKFTPATLDGRPVSMHIQLVYYFNLY